ncbi:MAG: peptidoglycan-binding protein [Caldilineaceae bacterium]
MGKNRLVTIALVLGLVVVVAVVSWIAGAAIQSPAEAAARTAPPLPAPILVPVEQRVLSADIVTRGTARFGLPQTVAIAPSALKAEAGMVTTLPMPGTQFAEGQALLTTSSRPLFVLYGEIPAYRDLRPGLAGNDVRQLEEALARLVYDPGPVDGLFDAQTSAAVAAWYTAAGWDAFGPTAPQLAQQQRLETALAAATKAQTAAQAAAATDALAVDVARANAELANQRASADVAATRAEVAALQTDTNATAAAQANAAAALAVAEATVDAVALAGKLTVQEAVDAQQRAARDAEDAVQAVARLTAELADLQATIGVQVPLDELVFLPALPIRVEGLIGRIGDRASGPILMVTNNQLAVDASLPLDEAPLVKPGMAVQIDEPELGLKATGVVERVATTPGTDGADGYHVYFETRVDETPTSLAGFSLRLTIPVESTGGAVTAVPIAALSLGADGASRVQVENGGTLAYVTVEPGFSADGFVEVTPLDGTLEPGQLVVVGYEQPLAEE